MTKKIAILAAFSVLAGCTGVVEGDEASTESAFSGDDVIVLRAERPMPRLAVPRDATEASLRGRAELDEEAVARLTTK
jgi:hypothetical protein